MYESFTGSSNPIGHPLLGGVRMATFHRLGIILTNKVLTHKTNQIAKESDCTMEIIKAQISNYEISFFYRKIPFPKNIIAQNPGDSCSIIDPP